MENPSRKTQHLNLQWGETRGRASFIVIIGLESPPVLIGMDIMRPLQFHIDVTRSTATPAQPDPQTIHLNAAQTPTPPVSHALLLQAVDIPVEAARLVRCHNPWPNEDVYFCPEEGLPMLVSGVPALTSGSEVWVAIHNHRPEPLCLHTGQTVGTLEIVDLADLPPPPLASKQPSQPPVPEHLSPARQQQLKALFQEFSDIISQGEDDLGCTPLLEHTIETEGPPLRQPCRRQNPAVCRKEMTQVQQMLSSGVICPSNSPWASPAVMVKKKDGSLRFCVDFRQLNAATIKDTHPIPRIDDLLDALHGARWFSTLDLRSGYWQVPIQEQDEEKTAFRTSSGQLFEFNQYLLASATLLSPSPASWIESWLDSTGKPASSTSTISSSSPPLGKSTSPASDKSSSGSATPSTNLDPRNAHLQQLRKSAISATGLLRKASSLIPLY